jgi:hypothetical protein
VAVSNDALFAAIESKDVDKVRYLLNHDANANTQQTKVRETAYFSTFQ